MELGKIDKELLITLVETKPTIWDKSLNSNRDYFLRIAAWRDICSTMNNDFNTFSKKKQDLYVRTMMQKWTNIRDAWKKSFPRGARKPYIYKGKLKFLEKNFIDKNKDNLDDDSDSSTDPSTSAAYKKRTLDGKSVTSNYENRFQESKDANISIMNVKSESEESPHIMFMKGLLPNLNKLNEDETLDFQMGVIKLLQDIRKNSTSNEQLLAQNNYMPPASQDEMKTEP